MAQCMAQALSMDQAVTWCQGVISDVPGTILVVLPCYSLTLLDVYLLLL
jgi:hypothetical protein